MMIGETITVVGALSPDGACFLSGRYPSGEPVDPFRLRSLLFAWHERSGYGSFLETAERHGVSGVSIPAAMAVQALAEAEPMSLTRVHWDETALTLRQTAALLQRALAAGTFAPSYAKHREGRIGWTLRLQATELAEAEALGRKCAELALPAPDEWLDRTLEAWQAVIPELAESWQRVQAANPALEPPRTAAFERAGDREATAAISGASGVAINGADDAAISGAGDAAISSASDAAISSASDAAISSASDAAISSASDAAISGASGVAISGREDEPGSPFEDEEDWLIAIGWKADEAPFRIGLQLQEPDDEPEWTLRWVLQDRDDPTLTFTCSRDGSPEAPVPAHWTPFVADRLVRVARKAGRAVPRLFAEPVPSIARPATDARRGPLLTSAGSIAPHTVADAAITPHTAEGAAITPHTATGATTTSHLAADAAITPHLAADAAITPQPAAGAATASHPASGDPLSGASSTIAWPVALLQRLNDDEAWKFMEEDTLRLVEAGLFVQLPNWWDEVRKWKPKLKAAVRSSVGASTNKVFGLQQIVDFDWKVAIGGLDLTEEEFQQAAAQKHRLFRIRDRWVQLDPTLLVELRQLRKQTERQGLSMRDVLELHLLGEASGAGQTDDAATTDAGEGGACIRLEVELNEHLGELLRQLQETAEIPLLPLPEGLHGELRGYQAVGAAWLAFLRRFGLGSCLADDMGLGKTIQFITYLLHVRTNEQPGTPALLIAPTSVLGNWQKELRRFAPELKVHLHYGPQRAKADAFPPSVADADLVLTSYALAYLDEQELCAVTWDAICLDEAQNIKNAYAKQSAAIRRLRAGHRIALTGTPIENRLTELWSIFDFLNPGYLGSLIEFSRRFVNEIERSGSAERIDEVQRLVRPFLLRRLKKDPRIQLDLPEKNEAKAYVSLTIEQGALYEETVQELLRRIEKSSPMERRGLILAALTKLKQICNHPAAFAKEPVNVATAPERSNKLTRLLELLREMRDEGEQGLVFTQYVEMGRLLQAVIEHELGEPVPFLHGGVTKAGRDRMIAEFQGETPPVAIRSQKKRDDEGNRNELGEKTGMEELRPVEGKREETIRGGVMILSLKAGGTGLNLTAANHVFHYDRWWNPAVENQATDRAFRIGQTRDVQVHKFVTLGTLEERIDDMIERKQTLSNQIVGSGENWITELSTDELRDLFVLRKDWIEE